MVMKEVYEKLLEDLKNNDVKIKIVPTNETKNKIIVELISWLPLILICGYSFFSFKNIKKGFNFIR